MRVEGPLVGLVRGFRDRLNAAGYSPGSAAHQLQLIARLSRWMVGRSLAVEGLTPMGIDDFFRERRSTHTNYLTPRSLSVFLSFLKEAGFSCRSDADVPARAWEHTLDLSPLNRRPNWYGPGRIWSGDDLHLAAGARLGHELAVDIGVDPGRARRIVWHPTSNNE